MRNEKYRLSSYWFLNVDAFESFCLVVFLCARFSRYFPLIIVGPSVLVCVFAAETYRDRFDARMGRDKERMKSVKKFWRYFDVVLLFLFVLMCHLMSKLNYQS
jgi:hypothetical protein